MSKATERITINVTPEQYTAVMEAADGASVSDIGKALFADWCEKQGVMFPQSQPHGGKRPGAGRKKRLAGTGEGSSKGV